MRLGTWLACAVVVPVLCGAAESPSGRARSGCGLSFVVPPKWKMRVASGADYCVVALSPPPHTNLRNPEVTRVYGIQLQRYSGEERDMCILVGACKDGDAWFLSGRNGSTQATMRRSPCCSVVRGTREAGSYDEDGYRGTAEVLDALVIGEGRFAEAVASVDFEDGAVFDQVVDSVRFK